MVHKVKAPGRTRKQLAAILDKSGFFVMPEDISMNAPRSREVDGIAWEAYGMKDGGKVRVYSWDTMMDCVTRGIDVHCIDDSWNYEVSAIERTVSRDKDRPDVVVKIYIDDIGIEVQTENWTMATKDGQGVLKHFLCGDFPETRDTVKVANCVVDAVLKAVWKERTR